MTEPLQVFVGFDAREQDAYWVCRRSIERRSSRPALLKRLDVHTQRQIGTYRREWLLRPDGQRIDTRDRKPFSTDFAFSRFLVPALCGLQGWALFCDSDFLFTADLAELFDLAEDRYAVMCVKHRHDPAEAVKMDGQEQTRYRRKNWSSLMLWNCAHWGNGALSLDTVNTRPGAWLHGFDWLDDSLIGDLPATWNHLVGVDPMPDETPNGIHYTLGVPSMPGYENCDFADLWRAERDGRPFPAAEAA